VLVEYCHSKLAEVGKKGHTRVYPEVSRLAAWSKNCKLYGSLPLHAVVLLFWSQSREFCYHNPLCCFSTSVVVVVVVVVDDDDDSVWKLLDTSVSISRPGHVRRRVMNEP
jgi:hypothetical protein